MSSDHHAAACNNIVVTWLACGCYCRVFFPHAGHTWQIISFSCGSKIICHALQPCWLEHAPQQAPAVSDGVAAVWNELLSKLPTSRWLVATVHFAVLLRGCDSMKIQNNGVSAPCLLFCFMLSADRMVASGPCGLGLTALSTDWDLTL